MRLPPRTPLLLQEVIGSRSRKRHGARPSTSTPTSQLIDAALAAADEILWAGLDLCDPSPVL